MFCIEIIFKLVKKANWNSTGDYFLRIFISYPFRTLASFRSTSKCFLIVAALIKYNTLPPSAINCNNLYYIKMHNEKCYPKLYMKVARVLQSMHIRGLWSQSAFIKIGG
jgi:hypothetical protein